MIKANPSVTLALPAYNEGSNLNDTIASILNQSYTDFELLLADNGSTDNTRDVMREYAQRDSRIRILTSSINNGAVWNFRRLVYNARGEYFAWVGGHDLYDKDYINKLVSCLSSDRRIVSVFGQVKRILPDNLMFSTSDLRLDTRALSDYQRIKYICQMNNAGERIYGLFRREALLKLPLRTIVKWDTLYLSTLSLMGDMVSIPDVVWYRRFDELPSNDPLFLSEKLTRQLKILYPPNKKLNIFSFFPSISHLFFIVIDGVHVVRTNFFSLKRIFLPIAAAYWHSKRNRFKDEYELYKLIRSHR